MELTAAKLGGLKLKKSAKTNPHKRWERDACFSIYKDYFLNKNGGFCPECGCDCFTEVDHSEPDFLWHEQLQRGRIADKIGREEKLAEGRYW